MEQTKKIRVLRSEGLEHSCPRTMFYFKCSDVPNNCGECPLTRFLYHDLCDRVLDETTVAWLRRMVENSGLLSCYIAGQKEIDHNAWDAANQIRNCFFAALLDKDNAAYSLNESFGNLQRFRKWAEIPGNLHADGIYAAYLEKAKATVVPDLYVVYKQSSDKTTSELMVWPTAPLIRPQLFCDGEELRSCYQISTSEIESNEDLTGFFYYGEAPNTVSFTGFPKDDDPYGNRNLKDSFVVVKITADNMDKIVNDYLNIAQLYHPDIPLEEA